MSCGPLAGVPRRTMAVSPLFSSTGETAKMSTVMKPDLRNFSVASICALSWLTKGRAVFAPGKRWEWTLPSTLPGSLESTSGMWQLAQVFDSAG